MQKWGFSAIFSRLVHPIDLILHILNVLNGLHRWQRCIRLFKFLFLSLVFLVKCFGSIVICPTCLLSFFNFLHSFFFIHHSASPSSRLLVSEMTVALLPCVVGDGCIKALSDRIDERFNHTIHMRCGWNIELPVEVEFGAV